MPEQTAQNPTNQQNIVDSAKEYLQEKTSAGQPAVAASAPVQQPAPAPQVQQSLPSTQPAVQPKSVRGLTNIVDALFIKGLIDEEAVRTVKFETASSGKSIEKILSEKGLVSSAVVQETRAEMYGLGYIDLKSVAIDQQVLQRINKDLAERNAAIAFEENNNRVKVAMEDPLDLQKVKFLESVVKKRVDPYYGDPEAIRNIINTKYGAQISSEVGQALEATNAVDVGAGSRGLKVEDIASGGGSLSNAPVAKIVNMILDYAVNHGASDVHIEPRENKISVRYRIHGILQERLTLPTKLSNQVVTRIKILANMKIDEHRIPQDNRFQVKSEAGLVDIRVSVMPSIYGEKVVLRLLEKNKSVLDLEQTGLRGSALKTYRDALSRTQGIILITGPTGSGKTVTLSSSLAMLNNQEVNIVTVEDPVEIRIDGITQVQVNNQVGLTFPMALRSFLRQDPDIIMVGEIRDAETAELAVQAALTGHLVLATLHTNSAAGALPRLLDMGIEPFLLASTINVVVAQRLVRKLCEDSKQVYQAEQEMIDRFHKVLDGLQLKNSPFGPGSTDLQLYNAIPSPKCDDSGYDGRIGIFEVMTISDNIGKLIMKGASANDINAQAVSEGMITMLQDGFLKALEGATTAEEVLRVQNT